MTWIDITRNALPEYLNDIKLNLDSVIKRSTLSEEDVYGCALASAVASGNSTLVDNICIDSLGSDRLDAIKQAAIIAGSLMAMNNVWYPYIEATGDVNLKKIPAGLRMNAIATGGGVTKTQFEVFSLAASIVGKCTFCIKAHYISLQKDGYTVEQLRDIGRIASVINSVSKFI